MTARWSLVSTMHGVPETILPCIAHHLQTDAEFLHIYLDAPNPVVQAALASQPRCIVTVCDDTYWFRVLGRRPAKIVSRQLANLDNARQSSSSNWLVHIDSDEFIVHRNTEEPLRLAKVLSQIPPDHDWFRISPMERVLPAQCAMETVFDGIFRSATRNAKLIQRAYGPAAQYLSHGMSGHAHGKVGFRTKTNHEVRLHRLVYRETASIKGTLGPADLPPFTTLEDIALLHFDGWTPLHWTLKLQKLAQTGDYRKVSPGRRQAIEFIKSSDDDDKHRSLFVAVQTLSLSGQKLLERSGSIRTCPFNPIGATRTLFPDVELNFTPQLFDERLRCSSSAPA